MEIKLIELCKAGQNYLFLGLVWGLYEPLPKFRDGQIIHTSPDINVKKSKSLLKNII